MSKRSFAIEGGGGGGCPVLTFAIKPALFVDDGPQAYEALKATIAAEKAEKAAMNRAAKRAGLPTPEEDDEVG